MRIDPGLRIGVDLGGTKIEAIAIGPDGRLFVADRSDSRVLIFDPPFTPLKAAAAVIGSSAASDAAATIENKRPTRPRGSEHGLVMGCRMS